MSKVTDDPPKQLDRLLAGTVECTLQTGSDVPPGIVHLGAWLGEAVPEDGFEHAHTGNLIDTDTLAPILPDPAMGWSGTPGWRDGPTPDVPWSAKLETADGRSAVIGYLHPGGYRANVRISAVSAGLFELVLRGAVPEGARKGRIALGVPLPPAAAEAVCFGGRWAGELTTERVPLSGGISRVSRAGSRTAHDAFPALVTGSQGFSSDSGEMLGVHLGWWGNYELTVEVTRDGGYRVVFHLDPDELEPLAGGGFRSPSLYFGWTDKGLNGLRVLYQDGVRILRKRSGAATEGKIQLNTWEGVYFDHSEDRLKEMAGVAAAMGFERFVLDDGWFGRRANDRRGLGDWTPRPEVYPDGLDGLIDHVRTQGLEFGLWIEPEMVNADSALFEAHPEWIIGDPDQPLGRNQFGLDLTNPECFDHLESTLSQILADRRVASVKWDMNRDLPQAAGIPLAPAATRLVESIRAGRPGLEIEACASGGGRTDLGTLTWCNRVWLSDAHDPDIRTPMMAAYSLFAPPEVMGCHIGPEISHQTGRRWSMHVRASMSVLASMGMELDPLTLSEEEASIVAEYVALHRQHRRWLHRGHMLELDHPDPGLTVLGVFGADRDRALVFLLQHASRAQNVPRPLRVPHLRGDLMVSAPIVDTAIRRSARAQPDWLEEDGMNCSASFLAAHGLPVPIMSPMRGLLVEIMPAR